MYLMKKGSLTNLSGEELYQFFKDQSGIKEEMTVFRGFSTLFEKVEKEAEKTGYHFIFSTDDVDSYGDIIEQDGWELSRFKKNPVILWGHDHKIPAIGYAKDVSKSPVLNGTIVFAPKEIHPMAGTVEGLIEFGAIQAGSVGLMPLEWEIMEEKVGGRMEMVGIRFKKQELMEFSVCNVPANPFALTDSKPNKPKVASVNESPQGGFSFFMQGVANG